MAARHLKVRAWLMPDKEHVQVTVLKQTHIGYHFSEYGMSLPGHHSGCFKHEDVIIMGLSTSRKVPVFYLGDILFVVFDQIMPLPIVLNLEQWPKVKEAIEAYNEWGAKQ